MVFLVLCLFDFFDKETTIAHEIISFFSFSVMAVKNVTATRMTLLSLKNQIKVAQRGHKLLKDKQDGLMQEFLKIIKKAKEVRSEFESELKKVNMAFLFAQSHIDKAVLENTLSYSAQKLELSVETKNIMSTRIPHFSLNASGNALDYDLYSTRSELDVAIKGFSKAFQILLTLAEIEKSAENLAFEIEKTRRRVNALEHRLIPDLKDTLKFISMKLGEAERSTIVQVMAIKEMIERQEKAKRA